MQNNNTIGYTTGVFDLFHVGHVNILKNAKSICDKLIVGVMIDELADDRNKVIYNPFCDRLKVVEACKYVDLVVPETNLDKLSACLKYNVDVYIKGDDWKNTEEYKEWEKKFKDEGIKIVYFPYTKGVSSSRLKEALNKSNLNLK